MYNGNKEINMSYIKFEKENVLIEDINNIRLNDWNPKKKKGKGYKEVFNSIKNRGLLQPIMVRENPDENTKYEVIDGYQRYTACKELGYDKILIYNFGQLDDATAKSYTVYFETGVKPDKKLFNDLLIELKDQIDLPYSIEFLDSLELGEELEFTPEEPNEEYVPNYSFTNLTQDEFEFISENIEAITQELELKNEKDTLITLINEHKNKNI